MRKTQLIKMMEDLRDKKSTEIYYCIQKSIDEEKNNIIETFNLDRISLQIATRVSEAIVLFNSWKRDHSEFIKESGGYYGSLGYELSKFETALSVRSAIENYDINVTSEKLRYLYSEQSRMQNKVIGTYDTVISNLKDIPSAKLGIEYLRSLGFTIDDDTGPKECTAITRPIDTAYLLISKEGDNNG